MKTIFEAGDVVTMRTSSPRMTVENFDRGRVQCVWFIGGPRTNTPWELFRDVFEADALMFATTEK